MSAVIMPLTRRTLLAGGAALAFAAGVAQAQGFPSAPVKITVAVGPGSSPDVILRVVGEHLSRLWGEQVVVINQPGGAGSVAIRAVAAQPPDGLSLYMALASNFIALPELQANFPVDVVRDFVPIGFVGGHPMVIAASADLGVGTLPELMALAKKRKGELNVAAGNRGSILHLTSEWLRIAGGIDVTLLHYPAASQAITDVLGGRVHIMVDAITSMKGAIDAGRIKPLAVAAKKRLYNFPDLPVVADTFPGFEAMGWFALMAPPGTPAPLARKIGDDLRKVLAGPELQKRFEDLGTYIRPTTPEELTSFIVEQQQIWRPVIAETAKNIN
ncbi:MAG: tripartite tricarboxylate transporter substrate binding protein [Xanthobacteraceae bacterium]|nr:tripartite tricarboxylate transporter substrate binding protein [Xanthobacteraceae bacterium]